MFTTSPNNQMRFFNGTSAATPLTARAATLVWGKTPSLTRNQVVNKLVSTGESTSCGFAASTPRLDVRKALRGTSETALVGELLDPATGFSPSPETTPVTAKLYSGTGRQLKDTRSGYVSALLRKPISITSGQVIGPSTDALPQ